MSDACLPNTETYIWPNAVKSSIHSRRSECRPCVSGATPRLVRRASSHAGNPGLVPAHFQGLYAKLYRAMSDEVLRIRAL